MKRISVDIGGTFTDIVYLDDETMELITDKVRSNPEDIGSAVFNAIKKIKINITDISLFVHGTTVGLNTVVQKKGARVGLVTTEGFTDVLEMARGDRKELYGYLWKKPPPLVPRYLRMGINERSDYLGNIIKDVKNEELKEIIRKFKEHNVEAIAVCFLHSYANPENELNAGNIIKELWPEINVSLSHQVVREFREYERMSTTVLDAYIKKQVVDYMSELDRNLEKENFKGQILIVSPGGVLGIPAIKEKSIATFSSGPIGGVSGSAHISKFVDIKNLVTTDVGGTSFDVSLIRNHIPTVRHQSELLGYPVLMPGMDIRPIGAGGGSIARVDTGGLLTVGPDSAGANPGPMCYSLGGKEPTVTDAALVNGIIDPDYFLGGEIKLDIEAAKMGIITLGEKLGLSPHDTADGILTIAGNNMTTAMKEILIGQGYDPRDFSIMSYGGAGGLFASVIAKDMSIASVVVPVDPGVFSAMGMLTMDIIHNFSRTFNQTMNSIYIREMNEIFREMEKRGREMLYDEKINDSDIEFERTADICYEGQGHFVEVPVMNGDLTNDSIPEIINRFHNLHKIRYGHQMNAPAKTINIRLKAIGKIREVPMQKFSETDEIPESAFKGKRKIYLKGSYDMWEVLDRDNLASGNSINGPAIVEEPHSTIVVLSDQSLYVDKYRNIIIRSNPEVK
ncbi:MAG: hydantoinase/oxoprolinase family protein [Spirochaetes bacterium]|nr:hydantoinase/oxoprolinase family protein [Spirochaetota bacterium]